MENTFTITVATHNIAFVEHQIAHLTKIAGKIGATAPTAVIVGNQPFIEKLNEQQRRAGVQPRLIDAVQYQIAATSIKVSAEYKLIGKIAYDEAGVDVREVPGFTINPSFRSRHQCDHCNKIRRRNRYVVVADINGNQKQIGSSCVKDFIGHSPERLLGWLDQLQSLQTYDDAAKEYSEDEELGFGGHRPIALYPRDLAIGGTIEQIAEHGFISRRKMQEVLDANPTSNIITTSGVVADRLYDHFRRDQYRKAMIVQQQFVDAIGRFVQWVNQKDTAETFWFNVNQAVNATGIANRHLPFIAAAVAMWRRETEQVVERQSRPISQYFGAEGDRVELSLTVVRAMMFDSNFGPVRMIIAESGDGNVFTWTSTAASAKQLNAGDCISLVGTIKEHREYKGTKQTVLTRCKVK